jgi:hypothetical protein
VTTNLNEKTERAVLQTSAFKLFTLASVYLIGANGFESSMDSYTQYVQMDMTSAYQKLKASRKKKAGEACTDSIDISKRDERIRPFCCVIVLNVSTLHIT